MFLGQTGLAISFDSLWILAMLAPFYLVIRYGVIAREEAYLERKFGDVYTGYTSVFAAGCNQRTFVVLDRVLCAPDSFPDTRQGVRRKWLNRSPPADDQ